MDPRSEDVAATAQPLQESPEPFRPKRWFQDPKPKSVGFTHFTQGTHCQILLGCGRNLLVAILSQESGGLQGVHSEGGIWNSNVSVHFHMMEILPYQQRRSFERSYWDIKRSFELHERDRNTLSNSGGLQQCSGLGASKQREWKRSTKELYMFGLPAPRGASRRPSSGLEVTWKSGLR